MHMHQSAPPCFCTTVRKTARRLARTYDAALSGSGMNVTQLAVVRAVERHEGKPLSRIADDLAMDRTSLYRSLGLLRKRKWIVLHAGQDSRSSSAALSAAGRKALEAAAPAWNSQQAALLNRFGRQEWNFLASELRRLAECASHD